MNKASSNYLLIVDAGDARRSKGIPYLEDFILVRFKRVQLQLQVPQVPQSHRLRTEDSCQLDTSKGIYNHNHTMQQANCDTKRTACIVADNQPESCSIHLHEITSCQA